MDKTTILLYGRSRSGKSSQVAELAEYVFLKTGKRTRVYNADRGGTDPMRPHIELGIIEVIEQDTTDPWIFLDKAVRGFVRDEKGKWVAGKNDEVGLFAFESMTAFADALMTSLAEKSAQGVNVGGAGNVSFTVTGDGESIKVGGNNMAHFGICQTRIQNEVWQSQRLAAPYVLWTASASKDDDTTSSSKVIGPQVVGKALTSEVPRWFQLSFRIEAVPSQDGKPEKHILYLGNSLDRSAGNAISLGNTRVPLDSPELPTSLEPASLRKALELIEQGHIKAAEAVKKRLNLNG